MKKYKPKTYKKPFWAIIILDKSKQIINSIQFDPAFDRLPSSKELVNTQELAQKYADEVLNFP